MTPGMLLIALHVLDPSRHITSKRLRVPASSSAASLQ